ncbi:MAG: oligosaccharide flippase family protein [Syntrophobacterales bacterium]
MSSTKIVMPPPVDSGDSSYTARFAHGAFWSFIGTVGARFFGFAASVVVARVLGKVGFGELAMIQSTLVLLGTFAGLGIGMTATKFVAELRFKDPERTGRIIGLTYLVSWTAGGVMALFCILTAPWLAQHTLNAPHLAPELRLASILLFITAGFGPQAAILGGFQAFKAAARINVLQGILSLPITIPLVLYVGLRGAILAMIFTSLGGIILSSLALLREYTSLGIRPNFLEAWREKAVLWQFSLPAFLASVLHNPVLWAVYAILANQPQGYASLGLFSAAMQFQFLINGLSLMLAAVAVPMLAELHGLPGKERFVRAFTLNLEINWGLALVFSFMVLGLSPWLIYIYGSKFMEAVPIFLIVVNYLAIRVASSINGQAFYSSGKMWAGFLIQIAWALILLLIASILIPLYSA